MADQPLPSSNPEPHPAQRFTDFVCREIGKLTADRKGFATSFTVYLKDAAQDIDRGFYIQSHANAGDYDRFPFPDFVKMKKEAAMLAIRDIYTHNRDVSEEHKREIFKRGEMALRHQRVQQTV
jgi:hypothetical protein